jgi:Protein of unknown function (DUF3703)
MESTATTARQIRSDRQRNTEPPRAALLQAWSQEHAAARAARARGDVTGEWSHLERAHILSQPLAGPPEDLRAILGSDDTTESTR